MSEYAFVCVCFRIYSFNGFMIYKPTKHVSRMQAEVSRGLLGMLHHLLTSPHILLGFFCQGNVGSLQTSLKQEIFSLDSLQLSSVLCRPTHKFMLLFVYSFTGMKTDVVWLVCTLKYQQSAVRSSVCWWVLHDANSLHSVTTVYINTHINI